VSLCLCGFVCGFVVVSVLSFPGCAAQDAAPTAPVTIAPPTAVDTFTGTLIALGTNMHPFTVSTLGEVDITLQATTLEGTVDPTTGDIVPPADPNAVPNLTLAVGTPTTTIFGQQCAILFFGTQRMQVVTTAGAKAQLKGQALPGTFCVSLADNAGDGGIGLLPAPVDYTITVAHP